MPHPKEMARDEALFKAAALLALLPPIERDEALQGLESLNPQLRSDLNDMRRLMNQPGPVRPFSLPLPGFQADVVDGAEDYLDIQRDVDALEEVRVF